MIGGARLRASPVNDKLKSTRNQSPLQKLAHPRTSSIATVWNGNNATTPEEIKENIPPTVTEEECQVITRGRSYSDPFYNSWDYGGIEVEGWERDVMDYNDEERGFVQKENDLLNTIVVEDCTASKNIVRNMKNLRRTISIFDDEITLDNGHDPMDNVKEFYFPDFENEEEKNSNLFLVRRKNNSSRPNSLQFLKNSQIYSQVESKIGRDRTVSGIERFISHTGGWVASPKANTWGAKPKKGRKNLFRSSRDISKNDLRRKGSVLTLVVNESLQDDIADIIWDDEDTEHSVLAASLKALLCFLVDPDQSEIFIRVLLLTHQHFAPTLEILEFLDDFLKQIFHNDEVEETILILCRSVAVALLKKWMDINFHDFYSDYQSSKKMQQLFNYFGEDLIKELQKHYKRSKGKFKRIQDRNFREWKTAPAIHLGKLKKKLKKMRGSFLFEVTEIPVLELARQLTLIDHYLFKCIPPAEFICKNFTKEETSENITKISVIFQERALWIGTEIVSCPNLKQRRKVLEYFINLAIKLLALKNFTGVMYVFAGLIQYSVSRLKKTWKSLSDKTKEKWDKIETLCSPIDNFGQLRRVHEWAVPPVVKTPTIFLKDLTFIEERDTHYQDTDLLSVTKIRQLGKLMESLQSAQSVPYEFNEVPELIQYLDNVHFVSLTVQEDFSFKCEPKSKNGR